MKTIYVVTDYDGVIVRGFKDHDDAVTHCEEENDRGFTAYISKAEAPDDFVIRSNADGTMLNLDEIEGFFLDCAEAFEVG